MVARRSGCVDRARWLLSHTTVRQVRSSLGLSQAQLGALLGVHQMTVWKWEGGQSAPTPHQWAMLERFLEAHDRDDQIGAKAIRWLASAGVAFALFMLLKTVFDD